MSFLRTEISQSMKLASAASLNAGEANQVSFLAGKGDDTIVVQGNQNIIAGEQGDDNIMLTGDFNLVMDDCGDNAIYSKGNNNTMVVQQGDNIIYSEGNCNEIMADRGNATIESHGHNNLIEAGNGNHNILFTGDMNDVNFGNGNSTVYFFGTENAISGGDGNHNVKTLDWLIQQGQFTEYADLVESYATVNKEKTLAQSVKVDSDSTTVATGNEGIGSAGFVDESSTSTRVAGTSYSDSQGEKVSVALSKDSLIGMLSEKEKSAVASLDLTEQYKGSNRYVFAKGSKDGQVHVYDRKKSNKCIVSVENGNNKLYMSSLNPQKTSDGLAVCFTAEATQVTRTTTTENETTINTKASSGNYCDLTQYGETIYAKQTAKGTIDTYQYTTQYDFGNVNNAISLGNGTHSVYYTGSGGVISDNQQAGAKDASVYVQRGGIETNSYETIDNVKRDVLYFVDNTKVLKESVEDISTFTNTDISATAITSGKKTIKTSSPLIVDFNKDGKVSAQAGYGVDVDNNGKADGAATAGDKMLAMSDMNKNGKIDGTEVFGDQTVNPFNGQKINAANGFEALKEVAKSAYKATGINCINNGNVDLKALETALAKVGVKLGFISDDNVTNLEDLAHVKSINVEDYAQQNQTGDVQHNQLGSYTSNDGKTYKTDDVWFKLR